MTKVVFKKLHNGRSAQSPRAAVREQLVRTEAGSTTIRIIDAHSPSFAGDLQYVFNKNVAEARRENKRLLGVADIVPAKT